MRITNVQLLVLVVLAAGCFRTEGAPFDDEAFRAVSATPSPAYRMQEAVAEPDTVTVVEMRNVHFRVDRQLALNIRRLEGRMQPLPGHDVIDFGDPESFYIGLAHADIGMTMDNLTYLLQQYVFGYEGSPLTIAGVEAVGTELRQIGTLHNVVDIPFEMTAEVTVSSDGRIRLHPTSMLICDIPGQGLMEALSIELEDLLDLSGARGVTVEGNDLLMDPEQLLPPPAIRGRLQAVRVQDDELVQLFGRPEEAPEIPSPPVGDARNYMYYSGGTLRFGKLYMVEADLQIIDDDPTDPFDFYLTEYQAQLVAGYSRTMPDAGLAAYFPDYADIGGGNLP